MCDRKSSLPQKSKPERVPKDSPRLDFADRARGSANAVARCSASVLHQPQVGPAPELTL